MWGVELEARQCVVTGKRSGTYRPDPGGNRFQSFGSGNIGLFGCCGGGTGSIGTFGGASMGALAGSVGGAVGGMGSGELGMRTSESKAVDGRSIESCSRSLVNTMYSFLS